MAKLTRSVTRRILLVLGGVVVIAVLNDEYRWGIFGSYDRNLLALAVLAFVLLFFGIGWLELLGRGDFGSEKREERDSRHEPGNAEHGSQVTPPPAWSWLARAKPNYKVIRRLTLVLGSFALVATLNDEFRWGLFGGYDRQVLGLAFLALIIVFFGTGWFQVPEGGNERAEELQDREPAGKPDDKTPLLVAVVIAALVVLALPHFIFDEPMSKKDWFAWVGGGAITLWAIRSYYRDRRKK